MNHDSRPPSQLAVITGTTHGIGKVTSRELARAGRTVVMLCRDVNVAGTVREEILEQVPGASVHVVPCDLASLVSVRNAAATVIRDFGRIDLLVNNAGMTTTTHRMSADGFELTFASNHLGPFLLTSLLLERLSDTARVVNVASRAHLRTRQLDLSAVTDRRARYSAIGAYAQSKLANIMFTFALARRLAGTRICVNCLHPGVVASNLLPWWLRLVKPLMSRVIFDVERGARTTLYLSLSDDVVGQTGRYYDENSVPAAASALAEDVQLQESLWTHSSQWVAAAPKAQK